jgi:hypothetical protein
MGLENNLLKPKT